MHLSKTSLIIETISKTLPPVLIHKIQNRSDVLVKHKTRKCLTCIVASVRIPLLPSPTWQSCHQKYSKWCCQQLTYTFNNCFDFDIDNNAEHILLFWNCMQKNAELWQVKTGGEVLFCEVPPLLLSDKEKGRDISNMCVTIARNW